MQALMLAAGMGKRLGKYTGDNTKCMVEIAGKKLIDRAIEAVRYAGIKKMIIVVGYKGQNLIDYINDNYQDNGMEFVFINNVDYANSNNIYSFYLAKDYIESDDTILMESDLIYDKKLIKDILQLPQQNVAAIAKYKSWMDGTVVTCDKDGYITQFVDKADIVASNLDKYYKTVNIYKLNKEFCSNIYLPFLQAYMKAYGLNSYYETTLKVVAHLSKTQMYGYEIGDMPWYEIDDSQDLDIANVLFSKGKEKYDLVVSKFGGYWRYDKMLDFFNTGNPSFPTKPFVEKLQREFSALLCAYPSGLDIQNMNAERIFGVNSDYILTGNGASELIYALGETTKGAIAVGVPTFNEYVRCFKNSKIEYIDNSKWDYRLNLDAYKEVCGQVGMLCVVSPDNPSGAILTKEQALQLVEHAQKTNTLLLFDESFIDFAQPESKYTLLSNEILEEHPNLIVIKSISAAHSVAGLRLGVIATSNLELLNSIKQKMHPWNVNSFAEYYLQTYNLYAKDYEVACLKIADERSRMIKEINKLKNVRAFDSQGNYIMIDLKEKSSYKFCIKMLDTYNILIKDLSSINYFKGKNFIRVAIKDKDENDALLTAIKELL